MSLWTLDTDVLALYREGHAAVCRNGPAHPAGDLAITVISVEEQFSGGYALLRQAKRRDELALISQRLTDSVRFLARLEILTFRATAIACFEQ
jgi:tRNA(fMet)-specific endonuclease VapC